MNQCQEIQSALRSLANEERKNGSEYFFKTGPGQYGEGDVFIGVSVPDSRKLAKRYIVADMGTIKCLLSSEVHEDRTCALHILVLKYQQVADANSTEAGRLVKFYIDNLDRVNNWDLADTSAPYMIGPHLRTLTKREQKTLIDRLAGSENMWHRRVAIVGTLQLIRQGEYHWTMYLAEKYLDETQDLQHKATGWMLREVWKRDASVVENFLHKHYESVPRTTLRYAIERMPEERRQRFLKGTC